MSVVSTVTDEVSQESDGLKPQAVKSTLQGTAAPPRCGHGVRAQLQQATRGQFQW